MNIDTSSYYPEVPRPDGENNEDSLNKPGRSLFGDSPKDTVKEEKEIEILEESRLQLSGSEPQQPSKKNYLKEAADIFANFVSWVTVPLLMPVYGIILIFKLSVLAVIPHQMQLAVIFIMAGINVFVPMFMILVLRWLGIIDNVGLNNREERVIPYMISGLCCVASAWFVASRGAPIWVAMFFYGGAVAAGLNLIINFKWKISAHAAGIAGIIALLLRLHKDMMMEPKLLLWLLITIGVAGVLGSCRIWLGRHTVWQVLAGYVIGFCSVFFMMYIH